jgi:hypothetical protein
MFIVRVEHPVADFAAWKRTFDSDPIGRQRSGVRGYRITRPVDDAAYAIVELEFEALQHAEAFQQKLQRLWDGVQGDLIRNTCARILEQVEAASTDAT